MPDRLPAVVGGPGRAVTSELDEALARADYASARQITNELTAAGEQDAVLSSLAEAVSGCPPALELLLDSLDSSGVVRRFVGASLLDKSAVDDVSQDALISVAESIGSYDGRGKVTTWVHSIVRRRVVDHLRRQRETSPLPDDVGPGVRMSSMIATRATVQQLLADLPEIYRTPVTLRDIEGLPYAEIASKLRIPAGTVRSQVTRGRAMLAARLGAQGSHDTAQDER